MAPSKPQDEHFFRSKIGGRGFDPPHDAFVDAPVCRIEHACDCVAVAVQFKTVEASAENNLFIA
jgi:hypothetical protein